MYVTMRRKFEKATVTLSRVYTRHPFESVHTHRSVRIVKIGGCCCVKIRRISRRLRPVAELVSTKRAQDLKRWQDRTGVQESVAKDLRALPTHIKRSGTHSSARRRSASDRSEKVPVKADRDDSAYIDCYEMEDRRLTAPVRKAGTRLVYRGKPKLTIGTRSRRRNASRKFSASHRDYFMPRCPDDAIPLPTPRLDVGPDRRQDKVEIARSVMGGAQRTAADRRLGLVAYGTGASGLRRHRGSRADRHRSRRDSHRRQRAELQRPHAAQRVGQVRGRQAAVSGPEGHGHPSVGRRGNLQPRPVRARPRARDRGCGLHGARDRLGWANARVCRLEVLARPRAASQPQRRRRSRRRAHSALPRPGARATQHVARWCAPTELEADGSHRWSAGRPSGSACGARAAGGGIRRRQPGHTSQRRARRDGLKGTATLALVRASSAPSRSADSTSRGGVVSRRGRPSRRGFGSLDGPNRAAITHRRQTGRGARDY